MSVLLVFSEVMMAGNGNPQLFIFSYSVAAAVLRSYHR